MIDFLKRNALLFSVFITGTCVLVVEIVATRVLSPYFGNTIFTVSSVISVILAALSLGYYLGGRLSDKKPSFKWFSGIICLSGVMLLLFYLVGAFALPLLSYKLSITTGPLIASSLIFFIPAFLLGTLSPYAIKLQSILTPQQGVGSISGKIFFWSTLGSITGSLITGFVLIPLFGVEQIILVDGAILVLLGLLMFLLLEGKNIQAIHISFILLLTGALILGIGGAEEGDKVLYQKDGLYEKISIYDGEYKERPVRYFQQDLSSSGAMFLDSSDPADLVYDYTKYYVLYKIFVPEVKNALIIGGGAYSIPKALLSDLPDAHIVVSEIEPSLFGLAKGYFDVSEDPRLVNSTTDGRRLLHDSDKNYDLIFSDVYYSIYSIPAHFTTQEFFELAREKLSKEGVFIANLIGDLSVGERSFIFAEMRTFKTVFPNSYFFAVKSPGSKGVQNIIFVGHKSDRKVDFGSPSVLNDPNQIIKSLKEKEIDANLIDLTRYPILTDNYSPVEYLIARLFKKEVTSDEEKAVASGSQMLRTISDQLSFGPRFLSSPGHAKVQTFIIDELKESNLQIKTQTWLHFAPNGKEFSLMNIVGRFNPLSERRIILAAHYDSKKFANRDPLHNNMPVPGANDSASGVSVLIEVARMLSRSKQTPDIGIDFIFFDGEEGDEEIKSDYSLWKPLGSNYFVGHLDDLYGQQRPLFGVVLDMVCDKDLNIYKEALSVRDAPAIVDSFWAKARTVDGNVFKDKVGQFVSDDHTVLNAAKIPSILVIDFDYPPFHTTDDTLDKCSAGSLEAVAQSVYDFVQTVK